ncbi:hypothetical protein [Variovorax sp. DT-64]|uniref:hypothetical protein n=1 Tax=Variovorax sp. DT-64 TaxID=3396160 RepID=UPI003F1C3F90
MPAPFAGIIYAEPNMRPLSAATRFPELELSQKPELRRAQVDVLERRMLGLLERRHLEGRVMPWATIVEAAESSVMKAATDARLAALPPDEGFKSFDELEAQRDETGTVRLTSRP